MHLSAHWFTAALTTVTDYSQDYRTISWQGCSPSCAHAVARLIIQVPSRTPCQQQCVMCYTGWVCLNVWRSSCACWPKSASTVWHLNISHDAAFHSLPSLDDHSSAAVTILASAKNVYSNAGSTSLLLVRPSILKLFADGTSTPWLDTRRLQAAAQFYLCWCSRTLDLFSMRAYVTYLR